MSKGLNLDDINLLVNSGMTQAIANIRNVQIHVDTDIDKEIDINTTITETSIGNVGPTPILATTNAVTGAEPGGINASVYIHCYATY